jgi:hypothetical protein
MKKKSSLHVTGEGGWAESGQLHLEPNSPRGTKLFKKTRPHRSHPTRRTNQSRSPPVPSSPSPCPASPRPASPRPPLPVGRCPVWHRSDRRCPVHRTYCFRYLLICLLPLFLNPGFTMCAPMVAKVQFQFTELCSSCTPNVKVAAPNEVTDCNFFLLRTSLT